MKCDRRPTAEELAIALSIPPPPHFHGLGAWVEHLAATRTMPVSQLIHEKLGYSMDIIDLLFKFGAVYTSELPPEIPDTMANKIDPEVAADMKRRRELVWMNASREVRQSSPQRLLDSEAIVNQHAYVRVHLSPKRFPAFHSINWKSRIIDHGEDYVVLNKPPYLPVAPTVDNIIESSLAGAAAGINADAPLLITTRLDQVTEGIVILGKTPEFVTQFNKVVRGSGAQNGDVAIKSMYKKFYRALVATPPPQGRLRHHVKVKCRRELTPYFTLVLSEQGAKTVPKAQLCELDILSVESIPLGASAQQRFSIDTAYEVTIELITGRTHQIRAQLSAIGCPLLGDTLYEPLQKNALRSSLEVEDPTVCLVDRERGERVLAEPDGAIGLQASRIEVHDGSLFRRQRSSDSLNNSDRDGTSEGCVVFEAGPPWWR